ncbi:MAG: ribulose-phosphate 3-epimerase [Butyrivibrio sp.]|nr:ribulose-phosphate 3-epimerase [Butyrivibrio sp.]
MANILSPSILAADFKILGKQIGEADKAGAQYLHIDVMDGVFVPSISFGLPVIRSIRSATDRVFDVHLMIVDPIRYIKDFVDAGADIITFHLEAAKDPMAVIDEIHKYGKKAGLSIKPQTKAEALLPYLGKADMILVMTVEPGFGGQKLIPSTLEKVKRVRSLLAERGFDTDIQVDGGITIGNLKEVIGCGANVIVAGSSIFNGDITTNTASFLEIMG